MKGNIVATKTKVSPLTLVNLTLEPEQTYMIVDLLYETAGLYPTEKTQALIEYIEGRVLDAGLPLTIEEHQGVALSPEFEERKRLVLDFFADGVEEPEEIDCE
jgi:hypothetical protein